MKQYSTLTVIGLYFNRLIGDNTLVDLTKCATDILGRTIQDIDLLDVTIQKELQRSIIHLFPQLSSEIVTLEFILDLVNCNILGENDITDYIPIESLYLS